MKDLIFSNIISDLKSASKTVKHPFRYFTMATSDINSTPRLRTVVLREIDEQLNLIIYTDKRSEKINHINNHNMVSLLFFDSDRLIQLSIRAKAKIITDTTVLEKTWKQTPLKSRKNYTTEFPPGQEIKDPEKINFLERKHFFSAIHILPEQIEYLKLQRTHHIRLLFTKENINWEGTYLVP